MTVFFGIQSVTGMRVKYIFLIVQVAALIIAVCLFIYKYRNAEKFKTRYKTSGRWILWYSSMEILGTSSPTRRQFMQTQNRLSIVMWICVLLFIILFILSI
jgi:hypothetical protein